MDLRTKTKNRDGGIKKVSMFRLHFIKMKYKFYNFNTLESRNKAIVVESKNGIRYGDIEDNLKKEEYFCAENDLLDIIESVIDYMQGSKVVAICYYKPWVVNETLSDELMNMLKKHDISNSYKGGLFISEKKCLMEMIKSVFRFNMFVFFITEGVIITPTDHMDVFFDCANNKTAYKIKELLERINNGKYYVYWK